MPDELSQDEQNAMIDASRVAAEKVSYLSLLDFQEGWLACRTWMREQEAQRVLERDAVLVRAQKRTVSAEKEAERLREAVVGMAEEIRSLGEHAEKAEARVQELEPEATRLREALEMSLFALRDHEKWCGYRPEAPGSRAYMQAVEAAVEVLGRGSSHVVRPADTQPADPSGETPKHGDVWLRGEEAFSVMHVCGHRSPPDVSGYWHGRTGNPAMPFGPNPDRHDVIPLPDFLKHFWLMERERDDGSMQQFEHLPVRET